MPKLLWLTPKNPLPPHDGARHATASLVKSVSKEGVTIHLAILEAQQNFPKQTLLKELAISNVTFVGKQLRYNKRLLQFLGKLLHPLLPTSYVLYNQKRLKNNLKTLLEHENYDFIVCDGLATFVPVPAIYNSKIIYRAHNVEHQLWLGWSKQKSNPLYKCIGWFESVLVKHFERSVLQRAKLVAAISNHDEQELGALQKINCKVIPAGFDFIEPLSMKEEGPLELLWIGKLNRHPNSEGLHWFLTSVWPSVRETTKLTVLGSNKLPYEIGDDPHIKFIQGVLDLKPYYADCHLCLVPLQYGGSGTSIKAIEAANFGRACLSTTVGIEGLALENGKSTIIADDAESWIHAIKNTTVRTCSVLGLNAFNGLKIDWQESRIAKKFCTFISKS